MAKVSGFLSWPRAFSPTFLPSSKSPGTDQHGSVAPAKNLSEFAVIRLEGTMETNSKYHTTGSLNFPGVGGRVLGLLLYFVSLPGSHWGGQREKHTHHTWPDPKFASVYCALGDLGPLGNILTLRVPSLLRVLCLCGARPPPWGESMLLLLDSCLETIICFCRACKEGKED